MHDPTPITDINQIDLDSHAVIEASAGTGKTYCIENLVVRLIQEKGIPLEQILLVTFTEKATGDLHERIRENLVAAIQKGEGDCTLLHQALENFDTACIFTIHGFCQRVLQQYAFENGGSFVLEVVDDGPLYESELRGQQRRDWPKLYGDHLHQLIALADYPQSDQNGSKWDRDILDIARRYRPEAGDSLLPEPAPLPDLAKWEQDVQATIETVNKELGTPKPNKFSSPLYRWYERVRLGERPRKDRLYKLILPLVEFLIKPDRTVVDFVQLTDRCRKCTGFDSRGFGVLVKDLQVDTDPAVDEYYEKLCRAVVALDALTAKLSVGLLANQLAADTVRRLKQSVLTHKEDRGLISYDDMLQFVARALDPAQNEKAAQLLVQLRRRFRYALVDEFQDTDSVQWQIFSSIFLGSPDHHLFVIGDPKQAIYSFRGADLRTYLDATVSMLKKHGASFYSLPINWRSMPGVIDALNRLCGTRDWFAPDGEVRFLPVSAPPPEGRRTRVYRDDSARAPLTVVNLCKKDRSLTIARRWMAKFISEEIERLLTSRSLLIERGGKPDHLRASDICVLVRKGSEAEYVEEFLARKDIPYSFYKKGGLYQSEESRNLYHLFRAIANPADQRLVRAAMLTRFFPITASELTKYEDLPHDHPIARLMRRWHDDADQRRWPQLFQSVLEDSGILYRESVDASGDRRLTNYRHILQDLEEIAHTENLDFAQLVDLLRNYRQEPAAVSDEENMHRIESEAHKVQIMTIHTCKGLEFPVVFLAGGFTANRENSFWRYHDDTGHVVYDLCRGPAFADRHKQENSEEDRRLYYVALTRAVHKLYVPFFRPKRNSGWSGPVATFIYDAIEAEFIDESSPVVRFVSDAGRDLGDAALLSHDLDPLPDTPSSEVGSGRLVVPDVILPPSDLGFPGRTQRIGSFSFFARHRHAADVGESLLDKMSHFSDDTELYADEVMNPSEDVAVSAVPTGRELPLGSETGSMLHEVFENVDFQEAGRAATGTELLAGPAGSVIDHVLRRYTLRPPEPDQDVTAWRDDVADIVVRTLQTPLRDGLVLADLGPQKRIHELEFFFPVHDCRKVPEMDNRNGFLTGYVDLIFRHDGQYFILDWKSNSLSDGYGQEQLMASMTAADYHLQYQVYTVAVVRWLQQRHPDFDFERDFGGVYYLYLRGMTANGDGVFYHRPDGLQEYRSYCDAVAALFGMDAESAK